MQAELTFPDAIKASEELLTALEGTKVQEGEFSQMVSNIVSTQAGARGFFVALLTGTFACSDDPPASLLVALAQHAAIVCDLLARNLVMSTTMAITHERKGDKDAAAASAVAAQRSGGLIKKLAEPEMAANLYEMMQSLAGQKAKFSEFLERWHYDEEQLKAAREAVKALI